MRTVTTMRLLFGRTQQTASIQIEVHPRLIRVAQLEGAVFDAWKHALRKKLKRRPTDKDDAKYLGKIHLMMLRADDKMLENLMVRSEVLAYLGQECFWRGTVVSIDKVHVTITH